MTTTSGLPAASTSGRTPVRAEPAMKRAFSIPLRSAFASASAIASGTSSRPQTSPALFGHRQADRADPAVEVEEPLGAGQARVLGGDRVEPLGHLGVGLEEGAVRHLQPQAAELLAQPLLAERPGRPVGAARVALDHRVEVDRGLGELGRRGDEPGLDLAGAAPLADDEVAQDARAVAPVVGRDRLAPGPVAHLVAGRVARLGGEHAVLDARRSGPSARGRGSRGSARRRSRRRSTRACCGSATARRPARSPPARSRRGRRSGAGPRRPGRACGRAGARREGPARERPGRARPRARRCRRRGRPPASAARPSWPRRSASSSSSPRPAPGRRAGRRRRRRRGRRCGRHPARRRRASRSPARAGPA